MQVMESIILHACILSYQFVLPFQLMLDLPLHLLFRHICKHFSRARNSASLTMFHKCLSVAQLLYVYYAMEMAKKDV